jgi:hypothetical protein
MALSADQRTIRTGPPSCLGLMDTATPTVAFSEYSENLITVLAQNLDHWRGIFRQLVPDPSTLQFLSAADALDFLY